MYLLIPFKTTEAYDLTKPLVAWVDHTYTEEQAKQVGIKEDDSPELFSPDIVADGSQHAATSATTDQKQYPGFTSKECIGDLLRLSALRNVLSEPFLSDDVKKNPSTALEHAMEYHATLVEFERHGFPVRDVEDAATECQPGGDDVATGKQDEGQSLRLTWNAAFGANHERLSTTRGNIRYERCATLFNVAALLSIVAINEDFASKEGLTRANQHYASGAVTLSYLRTELLSESTDESLIADADFDLSHSILEMCEKIMLAQGQCCVYELAMLRPKPQHFLCAKLAAGAADLFDEASSCLSVDDAGADTVRSALPETSKAWASFLKAIGTLFRARAAYHEALSCHQKKKIRLEIEWLKQATFCCEQLMGLVAHGDRGIVTTVGPGLTESIIGAVQTLKSAVRERKTEAEAITIENSEDSQVDLLGRTESHRIRGQNMMTKLPPLNPALDPSSLSTPLFTKTLRADAKLCLNNFHKDMDDLISRKSKLANDETDRARNSLAGVNLPQSLAAYHASVNGEGGLPPQLWEQVHGIQTSGEVQQLKQGLWDLKDISEMARGLVADLTRQLDEDLDMDRTFCEKFPEFDGHNASEVQAPIRQHLKRCDGWLENARNGDSVLLQMLETFETDPKFKLLLYNREQLDRLVPSPRGPTIDTSSLGRLLVELSNLIKQRDIMCEKLLDEFKKCELRSQLSGVDPNSPDAKKEYDALAAAAAVPFHRCSSDIQQNLEKQPALLESIYRENSIFRQRLEDTASSAGQLFIQTVEDTIATVARVKQQLAEGRKFYDAVLPRLEQLKTQVSDISVRLTVERCDFEDRAHLRAADRQRELEDARLAASLASGAQISSSSNSGTERDAAAAADLARQMRDESVREASETAALTSPIPSPQDAGAAQQQSESRASITSTTSHGNSRRSSIEPSPPRPPSHLTDGSVADRPPLPRAASNLSSRSLSSRERSSSLRRPSTEPLPPGQPGVQFVSNFEKPPTRVNDEMLANLISMDFDPEKARAALQKYDNNLDQALNELLSG